MAPTPRAGAARKHKNQPTPGLPVTFLDWVKVGVREWGANLDRQALFLFRNELNYK
jgi:hypothetical protein